jgi:hypothetical protein
MNPLRRQEIPVPKPVLTITVLVSSALARIYPPLLSRIDPGILI